MAVFSGPEIVNNGLVLQLDAANLRSYPGTGTAWTDLSGIGNNGTLVNGPTYNSNNNNGYLTFDGTNDYLNTSYNIEAATSSNLQSLCSWLYGTSTNSSFFGSGASSAGQFHLILNFQTATQIRFGESYYGGSGGINDQLNLATVVSNPTWNYACIVKTAVSTFDVYLNGSKVIANATKTANGPASFSLGRWWTNQPAPASISNVSIYNRALTAAEIRKNFESTRSRYGI
jgi:hypothetical protein